MPAQAAPSFESSSAGGAFMPSFVSTLRVVISSEPRLLHILRGVVIRRARQAGFSDPDAECLAMAVSEAASNVIRHTLGNRHDDRLGLEVNTYPDRMELVLEDTGPKVQPESVQPRPLEEVRPGGLGTYFIKCFVDTSSYDESFANGNRLKLVKYLSPKAADRHESRGPDHG
jgi:anti-sigma regulatory factor (Ser/Thr protein kinase)